MATHTCLFDLQVIPFRLRTLRSLERKLYQRRRRRPQKHVLNTLAPLKCEEQAGVTVLRAWESQDTAATSLTSFRRPSSSANSQYRSEGQQQSLQNSSRNTSPAEVSQPQEETPPPTSASSEASTPSTSTTDKLHGSEANGQALSSTPYSQQDSAAERNADKGQFSGRTSPEEGLWSKGGQRTSRSPTPSIRPQRRQQRNGANAEDNGSSSSDWLAVNGAKRGEDDDRLKRSLTNSIWACESWEEVLKIVASNAALNELKPRRVVVAVSKLQFLLRRLPYAQVSLVLGQRAYQLLEDRVCENADSFDNDALSNVLVALAEFDDYKPRSSSHRALRAVAIEFEARLAEGQGSSMHSQLLCRTLAAFHRSTLLRKEAAGLQDRLVAACCAQLAAFAPQQKTWVLKELVHSGALRRHGGAVVRLCDSLAGELGALGPMPLADLAWAMGHVRNVPEGFVQAVMDTVAERVAEMSGANLAAVLWACAACGQRDPHVVGPAFEGLAGRLQELKAPGISSIAWSMGKLGFNPGKHMLDELAARAEACQQYMSTTGWANLLWGFVKLGEPVPGSLLQAAAAGLTERAALRRPASPRDLAVAVWAFGCVGYTPPSPLCERLLQACTELLPNANEHDISNLLYGAAQMEAAAGPLPEQWRGRLLAGAAVRGSHLIAGMTPQALANVAWSLAKLGCPGPEAGQLLLRVTVAAATNARSLQLRDTVDILWAFARLQVAPPPEAAAVLVARFQDLLRENPAGASMRLMACMSYALGTLRLEAFETLLHIDRAALPRLASANGQDVANLLWGFARLERPLTDAALLAYEARMSELLAEGALTPDEVSVLLWSLAKLEHYPSALLMDRMLAVVTDNIDSVSARVVGGTMYACGELRHHPGPLLGAVAAWVLQRPQQVPLREWSAVLWGFTRLGEHPGALFDALHAQCESGSLALDPHLLATAMWSLASFGAWSSPLHRLLLAELQAYSPGDFTPAHERMLYQGHLLACACGAATGSELGEGFRSRLRPTWLRTFDGYRLPAQIGEIAAALQRLGLDCSAGQGIAGGLFRLDLTVHHMGRKICIEVLGPHKLVRNTDGPTGRVLYRRNMLHALGWAVASLPVHAWSALEGDEARQDALLTELLSLHISELSLLRELRAEQQRAQPPASAVWEGQGELELVGMVRAGGSAEGQAEDGGSGELQARGDEGLFEVGLEDDAGEWAPEVVAENDREPPQEEDEGAVQLE